MEQMSTKDTLLAFSEWLDGEGFRGPDDDRTHQDLANAFIEDWEGVERGATLAGSADGSADVEVALNKAVDTLVEIMTSDTSTAPERIMAADTLVRNFMEQD